ncbi:hypothetical protein [Demequina soli]|uniref:hypothetical protein n=1 Tax=Demequina soli TaxID=1638987 RepID=UPI0007855F4E|nr:hypothetical protein [Demequina soli]
MTATYLLDTNVILRLPERILRNRAVSHHSHIPEEVLYEARFAPHIERFRHRTLPVTAGVLDSLQRVWDAVPEDDTSVVDLFRGKGNADPLLVAIVLDQRSKAATGLFGDAWKIVSNDAPVRRLAESFEIPTLDLAQFTQCAGG